MKRIVIHAVAAAILLSAFMACQKTPVSRTENPGYLSFNGFALELDEEVETKAAPASGSYVVSIIDSEENVVLKKTYAEIQEEGVLTLPGGQYTLVARSEDMDVPMAEFEKPIYGTSHQFTIVPAQTTVIGELVCTLLQCKVTVTYSDEFLASVTGECSTTVTLTAGHPLKYSLSADGTYEQKAGYFAVNGNTMEVIFNGSIDGKNQKMPKVFTGIGPKQWRQVHFVKKVNPQGNATFDIVINDLVSDETLNNTVSASDETILGEDPQKPKGDGGITLVPDYAAGCDAEITDLANMVIVPVETRDMVIKLKATVPGGVRKFTVDIASDNQYFNNAVAEADATSLDLINPSEKNAVIFTVVPFPHGEELLGKTEIDFDLSAAQDAIVGYPGTHTFTMNIMDNEGCSKLIPVTMIVE